MKQLSTLSNTILKANLVLLIVLFIAPVFGQKESKEQSFKSKNIENVFTHRAVTPQEMTERASHHPYMKGEIVVAIELQESKSSAMVKVRDYEWSQLFGSNEVKPMAYLMTKELQANQSVSLVHLSLPDGLNVFDAMNLLDGQAGVLWSSPNFYFEGDPREIVPNDPSYGSQYHHPLMQNDLAWDITYGSSNIMLGITDDGVETTHSDLSTNIWVNPGEIPGNGIDDDNNGYIDDVNGWDFSGGNNDPNPNSTGNDHGTHVAGICAGRTNNSIGIAGVSGHSKILPIQFYAGGGSWTAAVCNASFTYAADNGANVVNTSYNINGFVGDPVFTAGMQYMHDNGVLHFNSAGNGNELNPARQAFHQTLLTVSTDASDIRSSFSNYGTGCDISAPGSSVYSTVTSNGYGTKSGTSMAAPNAAGAAALIWSANPSWNSYQVAAQLLATADDIDPVNPAYAGLLGSGRVNTYQALTANIGAPIVKSLEGMPDEGSTVAPDVVTDFTVSFSQVMDPATVNNILNFELSGAGPDNIFGNGDDVLYNLTTSTTYQLGTNFLTYNITGPPFISGLHRLRLVSGGLANPHGTALDGDENGTGGDDFIRNFTIASAAGCISTYPYTQNFDSWLTSSPAFSCTADGSITFSDNWTNVTGDNIDWDILTGATGSTGTGPSSDHTSGSGNYLYTESSSCYGNTGEITSPCFDLSVISNPELTFWYHMYGSSMGTLSVQVSTDGGSSWSADLWTLSGDKGNSWFSSGIVSLNSYTSQTNVIVRWTGTTGSSYTSDMAIDDVTVDGTVAGPPVANFTADDTTPAIGQTVNFTDASSGVPTSWAWSFSPTTISYVGSTTSGSQNPQVQFNASGYYTVTLTATNGNGSSAPETKIDYILVGTPGNWTGNTSTAWGAGTNWETLTVPGISDDVTIPASAPNWPTYSGNLELGTQCLDITMEGSSEMTVTGDLTIPSGRSFTCNGANILHVVGDWINAGTFVPGTSTVEFNGTSNSNISLSKSGKGTVEVLNENFDGGSVPSGWAINNSSTTVIWNIDATPNPPGYYSAGYSLNYNDGTDFNDGGANNGTVTTNAIDNSGATSTTVSFYYQLGTEGNANWDWVLIQILDASDNSLLQSIGGDGTSIPDISTWTLYTITGDATVIATPSIKLRFIFTTDDGQFNTSFGWFIDDLKVEKFVPSLPFYHVIDNKSGGGEVITGTNININGNLTVKPGAYLTNNSGNTVDITGDILLEAEATGMASYLDNGTTTVSGNTYVEQHISAGAWHLVSSPVTGAQSGVYEGLFLYEWLEPTGVFLNIVPLTTTLDVAKGYYAWSLGNASSPTDVTFTGNLNTGNKNPTLTYNPASYTPPDLPGWNLEGNPYPSALVWDNTWSQSSLDPTVYVFDAAGSGNWLIYNYSPGATGNTLPNAEIPPTQGFYVKANAASPSPSMTIPNNNRVHTTNDFYKTTQANGDVLEIDVTSNVNTYSDRIFVVINDNATNNFDSEYDAYKLKGIADAPQLYTVDTDENELSVNTIPPVESSSTIPLNLEVGIEATYKLSLAEINGFDGTPVYLEDLQTNTIVNMKSLSVFKFAATPDDNPNRFLLHFGYHETPPIVSGNSSEDFMVYSYNKTIVINAVEQFSGEVKVYDILGREILSDRVNEIFYQEYQVNKQSGYYVVKVHNEGNIFTEKVFIK